MYYKDYTINNVDELERLVEAADYYCCLPIISRTLDGVMLRSIFFEDYGIEDNKITCLELGAKLRNKKLFTEALIYLAGYWATWPMYYETYVTDEKLKRIIHNAHNAVAAKIARILEAIHFDANKISTKVKDSEGNKYEVPHYLRLLYEQNKTKLEENAENEENADATDLKTLFESVLKSNLILNNKGCRSGEGDHEDYLFSAELDDEELPWDINERDW